MNEDEHAYREHLTPAAELERRTNSLQERLRAAGMAGLLALHPVDLLYFSGTAQNGWLWIPAAGEPVLYVVRSLERAREESALRLVRPRAELAALQARVRPGNERPVGLEMDVLPVKELERIQALLPATRFEDATPLIQGVRQVKSAFEVACMRSAAERHGRVFRKIPDRIRPGMTELELSAALERDLRLEGHQGLVRVRRWNLDLYYGPVVSGPSACHPSGFDGPVGARGLYPAVPQGAGRRRLRAGDPVLVDLVFGYNGYFVDQTRTFFLGPPCQEYVEAHDLCVRVQDAVLRHLRPGVFCDDLYREVTESFRDASPLWEHFMGCAGNRVRFLGHGVGLELDEWPVLAAGFHEALQPGMTVAVEPKVFLPGRGGIGVENTFLVTEAGPEKLTAFPDDPVVVDAR